MPPVKPAQPPETVFITGASGGLGEALAYSLATRGAVLVLGARRLKNLDSVARRCRALGAAAAWTARLDVASEESARRFCRAMLKKTGERCDTLVNNAGIHTFGGVAEMPAGMLEKILAVNAVGPARMVRLLSRPLRQARGQVVMVSSSLAWRGLPRAGAYAASKAALDRLAESLRDEMAPHGVHVMTVHPGVIDTALRDHAPSLGGRPSREGLPLAATAEGTARKISAAMARRKKRLVTAPWPLRLMFGGLSVIWPSILDRVFAGKDASRP